MMNTPRMSWDMNVNTWLQMAGFAVVIGGGTMAYGSFKAETEAWRLETTRQMGEIKIQQTADTARMEARASILENSVNNLTVRDARTDERLNNVLQLLQKIDDKLNQTEAGRP